MISFTSVLLISCLLSEVNSLPVISNVDIPIVVLPTESVAVGYRKQTSPPIWTTKPPKSEESLTKEFSTNITTFFLDEMRGYLKKISVVYSDEVGRIIKAVEETPLKHVTKTISLSERLGRLTQTVLAIFNRIEQVVNDYELLMSRQDWFIRREYTFKKSSIYS